MQLTTGRAGAGDANGWRNDSAGHHRSAYRAKTGPPAWRVWSGGHGRGKICIDDGLFRA